LLLTVDSREISEWIVYCNLDFWKEHFAAKAREAAGPATSEQVIGTLFSSAKRRE
jgi:hypothetical protein